MVKVYLIKKGPNFVGLATIPFKNIKESFKTFQQKSVEFCIPKLESLQPVLPYYGGADY